MDLNAAFLALAAGDSQGLTAVDQALHELSRALSWPDDDARLQAIEDIERRLQGSRTKALRTLRGTRGRGVPLKLIQQASLRGAQRPALEKALGRPLSPEEAQAVVPLESARGYLARALRMGLFDAIRRLERVEAGAEERAHDHQESERARRLEDRAERGQALLDQAVLPAYARAAQRDANMAAQIEVLAELRRAVADKTSARKLAELELPDADAATRKRSENARTQRWSRARRYLEDYIEQDHRGDREFRELFPFVLNALDECYRFRQPAVRKQRLQRLMNDSLGGQP